MTILKKIFFILALLSLLPQPFAKKYSYEVGESTTSTVTEKSFLTVFYEVIGLYQTEISQFRIPVIPVPEWENPYITAYVAQTGDILKLGFWGGMARVPGMNDDAVALITCHEVGHIIGGAPYIGIDLPMYEGLSSEGQADYFATYECLQNYFAQKSDTIDYLSRVYDSTSDEARLCSLTGLSQWDEALCLRVANAINGFSHVLELLKGEEGGEFSLLGHDHNEVEETLYNSYPSNQCRINTFIAGLFKQDRPHCWYISK